MEAAASSAPAEAREAARAWLVAAEQLAAVLAVVALAHLAVGADPIVLLLRGRRLALLRQQRLQLRLAVRLVGSRIDRLRRVLGEEATQDDYRSHLLISDGLLKSLGLDRKDVDQFIKRQSSL